MALSDNRNDREYTAFTTDSAGNPALRVVPTGAVTAAASVPASLNDRRFVAFVADLSDNSALRFVGV